jgi:hypothetical protein
LEAAAAGLAFWLLVVGIDARLPRSPRERPEDAAIVRHLVTSSEQRLSRDVHYRLDHGSDSFNSIYELGVVDELRADGYRITVEPAAIVLFGRHMIDDHAASYPALRVVAPYETTMVDDTVIALSDARTPAERAREADLSATLIAG